MRRKFIAILSIMGMALFVVVVFPKAAMASDCVLTPENNPNTGHAHRRATISFNPVVGVRRKACYKLGVHGAQGGLFYFHLEVQDTVDVLEDAWPLTPPQAVDDHGGCVEMQWRTPGTTPWVTKVKDCNSADWQHDGWLSPLMNPIANGVPTSFDFRIKMTTRYLHNDFIFAMWRTRTDYFATMRVDY